MVTDRMGVGRPVAVRWVRVVAVIGATALLLASSCSWQSGIPIPDGVPPPAGDPVPAVDTYAKGRPADQLARVGPRPGRPDSTYR